MQCKINNNNSLSQLDMLFYAFFVYINRSVVSIAVARIVVGVLEQAVLLVELPVVG